MTLNKVLVIGVVVADPEVKTFEGGRLANLRLAINTFNNSKDPEKRKETCFINAKAWNFAADKAMMLKKGSHVLFECKLKQNMYEDKDGNKRSSHYLDILNFTILNDKQTGTLAGQNAAKEQRRNPSMNDMDDFVF